MSKQTDELVQEIDEIRERLANTVDELVVAVHPRSIARRTFASIKSRFVDETGAVRTEVVLPIAGAAAAVIVGAVVVRRIVR